MGFLSKAWKGLKNAVKKTVKRIKNVAKKVITSTPWGEKLWKLGGKIGTGILKGIGKVTKALGPIGMIALSVLAPYAAPLWSSFGVAATTAANAGSIWGSIGSAIYKGASWVGGTLSSMTSGISNAIGNVASGSFGKAADSVVSGFADAFTGKAGAAGIEEGVKAMAQSKLASAAGQSVLDQTISKISTDLGVSSSKDNLFTNIDTNIDQNIIDLNPNKIPEPMSFDLGKAPDFSVDKLSTGAADQFAPKALETQAASVFKQKATEGAGSSLMSKAAKVGKALIDNMPQALQEQQSYAVGDVGGNRFGGNAFSDGGVGSAGGSFLSPAMQQAMQLNQRRMAGGFR